MMRRDSDAVFYDPDGPKYLCMIQDTMSTDNHVFVVDSAGATVDGRNRPTEMCRRNRRGRSRRGVGDS